MHLDHEGNTDCTHSVAECVAAIASEETRRGFDYVRVEWDAVATRVVRCFAPRVPWSEAEAIEAAVAVHDPFCNGGRTLALSSHDKVTATKRGMKP